MLNVVGQRRTRAAAIILASLGLGLICLVLAPGASSAAARSSGLGAEERTLCQLVNQYRARSGIRPLRVSPGLTRAAGWLSRDMARSDTFDHVDSRGRDFDRRIRAFGFKGRTMGENLAGGNERAAATFAQLKASAHHRRNMLRAQYTLIGVGRAYRADTMLGWYWTTTFGAAAERGVAC